MTDDLEKCFEFILEMDKLKAVTRKVKPLGLDRYENSAEHSWSLALLAVVLAKESNQPINIDKVIKMLLVHDIGEIDANDVFFFDEAARDDVKEKELQSVTRIFGILPEEQGAEFLALWKEFEAGETEDAKFARAVDRMMPVLQNLYNNKQSWTENNVTKEQILTKTAFIGDSCETVWKSISEKINIAFD